MLKQLSLLLLLVLTITSLKANTNQALKQAQYYLEKQNEVYFSFPIARNADIDALANLISVDRREGNIVYAYANTDEFNAFLKLDYAYTVLKPAGDFYDPQYIYDGPLDEFDGRQLLNYDQYIAFLKKCETDYPDICKYYEVGNSGNNKMIGCLRITKDLKTDPAPKRPRYYFACAVHGDELNGTVLAYGLIDFLVKGYRNNDPLANKYLEGLDFWIAPHLNPDGTYPRGNTMSGCKRSNASGQDLNRSYPSPNLTREEYDAFMRTAAPETKVTTAFEKKHKFNFALDNHDAMREIIVHWASKRVKPVTLPWMNKVGGRFGGAVGGWRVTQAAFSSGGVARGTRMDWQPFYNHCWGFTLEYTNKGVSTQCTWSRYKSAILGLCDDAMCGITGVVTGDGGKPLDGVKVVIKKNGSIWDKDGSEAYSREAGFYIHYAPAGTYDVEFSYNGKTKSASNIAVVDRQPTKLDMSFDETGIDQNHSLSQNAPKILVKNQTTGMTISWPTSLRSPQISIYSFSGQLLKSIQTTAQNGNSIRLNFSSQLMSRSMLSSGCYIVQIHSNNTKYTKQFISSW